MKISKSLIQHCERSELCLYFEWTKVNQKYQKWSILASFGKTKACGQKVLPDRSVFVGQKLVGNAKIEKFKCDILINFQIMCSYVILEWLDHPDDVSRYQILCNDLEQYLLEQEPKQLQKL